MSERKATIGSDEDAETGFLLADDLVPDDPRKRAILFARRAEDDWGISLDVERLMEGASLEPVGFVDDGDSGRRAKAGEVPDLGVWWVFDTLEEV